MTPSRQEFVSRAYLWTYPGCPVRILSTLDVIWRLREELEKGDAKTREQGGLLVAREGPDPRTTTIVDFVPFPQAQDSDTHFRPSPEWVMEAFAECPPDHRIVGYYRTDLDQKTRLRPSDVEAIAGCFQDPSAVFLVIAIDGADANACFFVRENGTVGGQPTLTFPFSVATLIGGGWPIQRLETGARERLLALAEQTGGFFRGNVLMALAGLSGVAGVLILFGLMWKPPRPPPTPIPLSLGLQVSREGNNFKLSWDRSAPIVRAAKTAGLVISDPSREPWDGSKEPLVLSLPSTRLESGAMSYTSFSFAERVNFRLEVQDNAGNAVSESVVSVAPAALVAEQQKPERKKPRERPSHVAFAGPERSNNPPSGTPRIRKDRTFAPPKSRREPSPQANTAMLEPPRLAMPSQVPHEANWASPAPVAPRPPVAQRSPATEQTIRQGLITITSEPSGANVEIDAMPAGVTPLTLQITPLGLGFTVTVMKDGFSKWSVQTFSTTSPNAIHAQLRARPR